MTMIQEPKHYIRFCADRELDQDEVYAVAEIIFDHLEDRVTDDEVIMHVNDLDQYCYIFTLDDDIVTGDDGTFVGDSISNDLMDDLPEDLVWSLEASLPDQTVEVPDDANEQQVQEAAIQQIRQYLKG